MSVVSVKARSFILALFIRDDGERFLLGDNGYDFKDSQLHFSANTIENDEVQKQGADGVMLAGQVRRSSVQSFDGYVGDATTLKETIEEMRRDFIAFFAKGHHFRVIYIDTARNAWQRKGGYLVDAPEVKELYQTHPDYHVGLNFEDVNYYSYDEDADGNEIFVNLVNVPVSTEAEGGLVWDEDGAVSEDAGDIYYDTAESSASGKSIAISDATEAPLASFQLDGKTSQNGTPTPSAPVAVQTTTGENVVQICGKNLLNLNDFIKGRLDNGVIGYANNTTDLTISEGQVSFTTDLYYRGVISGMVGVLPNTEYSYSMSSSSSGLSIFADSYDSAGNWISRLPDYTHFTTPNDCAYIRVSFQLAQAGTYVLTNPQLELSSTATAYEPYQGQSYTISLGSIELCKIGDYQDYIYKSGGKWYVRKECKRISLSAVVGWGRSENGKFFASNFASGYGVVAGDGYSDQFDYSGTAWSADFRFGITGSGNLWVATGDSTLTSVDLFNTWLGTHNPIAYFALATPTETEITNQALIAQLEAVLGGRTYAGINNIFTITPNEQGSLEISYYTKYQPVVSEGGYIWEAGGAGGATTVINNSIGNVNPIWKIYGPTLNPQLENATNGDVIEYVGLIAEGQTLVIDMGEQTAKLDGLNVISNVTGDFISLESGANTLLYSAGNDAPESEIGWSEIVG